MCTGAKVSNSSRSYMLSIFTNFFEYMRQQRNSSLSELSVQSFPTLPSYCWLILSLLSSSSWLFKLPTSKTQPSFLSIPHKHFDCEILNFPHHTTILRVVSLRVDHDGRLRLGWCNDGRYGRTSRACVWWTTANSRKKDQQKEIRRVSYHFLL